MRLLMGLLLAILCTFNLVVKGQEPISIHISESNGLPDVTFYSMVEDHEGLLWFASSKGLIMYNGIAYKIFGHEDRKRRAVFNVQIDDKGRIWCNNIAGQFFYVRDNELILFKDFENYLGRQNLANFSLYKNKLFIKKNHSVLVFDLTTKKLINTLYNITSTNVGFIDAHGHLFLEQVTTPEDLSIVRLKDGCRTRVNLDKNITLNAHSSFFALSNHSILMSSLDKSNGKTQLVAMNKSKDKGIVIQLPDKLSHTEINKIITWENDLYIATSKGVFVGTIHHNQFIIKYHFLEKENATAVAKDRNNVIWITTLANGIYIIPNKEILAYTQLTNVAIIEKRNEESCFIAQPKGTIHLMNVLNNTIVPLPIKYDNQTKIKALTYDVQNQNIFYTSDNRGCIYSEQSKEQTCFPNHGSIKSVALIKKDTYLISKHYGVEVVSPDFTQEISDVRSYKSLYSKINDNIYIADIEGVKVYNNQFQKETEILLDGKPMHAFDISETSEGTIWLATYENGVYGVRNNMIVEHLSTQNVLLSNNIYRIKSDKKDLWIVTENSIQRYNITKKTGSAISRQDGIASFRILDLEFVGDMVLFNSNKSVFGFNKNVVFRQKKVPAVYFSSVIINQQNQKIQPAYTLFPHEKDLEINFNVNQFESLNNIAYQYRLNDHEPWIDVKPSTSFVKFLSLPSGNFKFELRAKNKFGHQYSKIIGFDIEVLSPFYLRWWFVILMMLLTGVFIYAYFYFKTKRLKENQVKNLEKEKISKALIMLQLENLRSQMNPHFIFNALNSIQDYIISNEKKLARQFLVKFSRLIRIYLEHSQKEKITLEEEIIALNLYLELEQDRFNNELTYQIKVDQHINPSKIFIPSLFIQPYVENAIKHGLLHKAGDKYLSIEFLIEKATQTLLYIIDDNGVGRDASERINKNTALHRSFATQANQRRIDLLNAYTKNKIEIEIFDKKDPLGNSTGTKVIIKYPL